MSYIDGFLVAVPTDKKADYYREAEIFARLFKEQGALRVVEAWGDDVPPGKLTSMPLAVQCKDEETVVFSWIEWPNKAVRDAGMQKIMQRPDHETKKQMPFDPQRIIFGGFTTLLDI